MTDTMTNQEAVANYIYNRHTWIDETLWEIFEVPQAERADLPITDAKLMVEKYGFNQIDFLMAVIHLGIRYDESFLEACAKEEDEADAADSN